MRLHLAQIDYRPAYYESATDYLAEPAGRIDVAAPLGGLRDQPAIAELLAASRTEYIDHIVDKLSELADWSGRRHADVLAFPEYSVPCEALPKLRDLAIEYQITIVAGSHRVPGDAGGRSIYQSLNLLPEDTPPGAAVAPVLEPSGVVVCVTKRHPSKWEPNLSIPPAQTAPTVSVTGASPAVEMGVVVCIDGLIIDESGSFWDAWENPPSLVICVALSRSVSVFEGVRLQASLNSRCLALVNSAAYGGTCVNIPEHWAPYLTGPRQVADGLPAGDESVLEVDINPDAFFLPQGTVMQTHPASAPRRHPVVFRRSTRWTKKYDVLRQDVQEYLSQDEPGLAVEATNDYLATWAAAAPIGVGLNLKHLQHSALALYDGQLGRALDLMSIAEIPESVCPTRELWARITSRAVKVVAEVVVSAHGPVPDATLQTLQELKAAQASLPAVVGDNSGTAPGGAPDNETFTVGPDSDLLKVFQNRGSLMDRMRDAMANPSLRAIVVTGALGVGKTAFVECCFEKALADWDLVRVSVPAGGSIARILADAAYRVGLRIDADALSAATMKVFRGHARRLFGQVFAAPQRALLIDDVGESVRTGTARDRAQLGVLMEEAGAPPQFSGGRVIIVSSAYMAPKWLDTPGVCQISLQPLRDQYVRRMMEFHMRRRGLVPSGGIPEPPQALLDMVRGHPLSAVLAVEALREGGPAGLTHLEELESVERSVASQLIGMIPFAEDERALMHLLSVFRLPVKMALLGRAQVHVTTDQILTLAEKCALSIYGDRVHMHEAVRRHFYGALSRDKEALVGCHREAVAYYRCVYDDLGSEARRHPSVVGELAHHLAASGDMDRARDFLFLVLNEIKPVARVIYRKTRDYERALRLYRMVVEVAPDDAEALAYMGRCHGRLRQWAESDRLFARAVDAATRARRPTWWIHRDWGHIRARFDFFEEARQHLQDAAAAYEKRDPAILAALAWMAWRDNDREQARELFEEALAVNAWHEYTLVYFARFCRDVGDIERANQLEDQLAEAVARGLTSDEDEYDVDVYDDEDKLLGQSEDWIWDE